MRAPIQRTPPSGEAIDPCCSVRELEGAELAPAEAITCGTAATRFIACTLSPFWQRYVPSKGRLAGNFSDGWYIKSLRTWVMIKVPANCSLKSATLEVAQQDLGRTIRLFVTRKCGSKRLPRAVLKGPNINHQEQPGPSSPHGDKEELMPY